MASSFIEYKNNGFWVRDGLFEGVTAVLYLFVKKRTHNDKFWLDFEILLLQNSTGNYNSHMHLDLDKLLTSEENINHLKEVLYECIDFFSSKGQYVDFNFVTDLLSPKEHYVKGNWNFQVETYRLIKILIFLELLIFSKLGIKASDKIFYDF